MILSDVRSCLENNYLGQMFHHLPFIPETHLCVICQERGDMTVINKCSDQTRLSTDLNLLQEDLQISHQPVAE